MTNHEAPCFIELSGIVKAYDQNVVLKKIDLRIGQGEFLVLVGPSGCGKSTLLRCIAGLEEITEGTLRLEDRVINNVHPKDRDLAMVFQSYALYPHMTVAQNLGFSLTVRKLEKSAIDKSVRETAQRLGLSDLLDRYPKQLSGGQRQRVAVGRAIVRSPKAFLFDEPLSNLDAALRTQMRLELQKLHQDLGATMIYVTHDQVEAMTLADRIVVLNDGIIQQVGTPDDLYLRPANLFVAHFIGSPPMNFLNATFASDKQIASGDGFEFDLSTAVNLPRELSADITVGVRPEDFSINGGDGKLSGVIEVIEPVGQVSYVHLMVGGNQVVAQIQSAKAGVMKVGQSQTLHVKADNVHLFDPGTQVSLRNNQGSAL